MAPGLRAPRAGSRAPHVHPQAGPEVSALRAALLVALALLAPLADAQTLADPITGSFTDVYVVTGRVIDSRGVPVARAEVVVELDQPGVRAAPLRAGTDCFGVFLTSFTLKDAKSEGEVKATLKGEGAPDATATAKLDPFHRRTDLKLRYGAPWTGEGCPDQADLWKARVSVTGRIVNRTDAYDKNGVTYESQPFAGRVRLWYKPTPEHAECPPSASAPGLCDTTVGGVDERGDFRYSWVYPQPVQLNGTEVVEVVVDGKPHNFTVDPEWRVATALIEATGRGAPPPAPVPAAPLALALMALAVLALARRRRA